MYKRPMNFKYVKFYESLESVKSIRIKKRNDYGFAYYCLIGNSNLTAFNNELKEVKNNNIELEKMWNSLNKKSLNKVLQFTTDLNDNDDNLNKKVYPVLLNLIDKKVKNTFLHKHKKYKKYMNYTIEYNNGMKSYKFWELFKNLTIAKNPYYYRIRKKSNMIELTINFDDGDRNIYFEIDRNKTLLLKAIRKGNNVNPRRWQEACAIIFNNLAKYNFDDYYNKKLRVKWIEENNFGALK